MNTRKLKQVFTILLIFLFCFYGICLSQGEAEGENGTVAKDFGRVPVNNKKEIRPFDSGANYHQTVIKEEDPFTFKIAEEKGVLEEWPIYEGHQSDGIEKDISPAVSASETESSPEEESEIESPTPDERPLPDRVEERISASDTIERRDFQEDPSVNEDDQKIANEKETSSAAPSLPITDLSTVEELPLSEEENISFLEEDEPPNSHQVNADESEPEYTKEKDIAPDLHSSHNDFRIKSKIKLSEYNSNQEVDTDYDVFFDVRGNDISPEVSPLETESPPGEESGIESPTPDERPLPNGVEERVSSFGTAEGRDFQEDPSVDEDNQKIADDKETPDAPPLPITELSTVEELPLSEEENTSSLEEDEPPISQQVNADEREPEYTKEEDIAPDLPEPFPAPAHEEKTFSAFGIDDSEISGEASLSSEDKQEVDTDYDEFFDVREKDISPAVSASETESPPGEESEIESPTPDERPFPDGVEEEISDSDTTERRDFQEDPSVDEDDQKIADDKETPDAPPLPIAELSTVEELPLSEEENTSSLEEDEPPISQQVNADEREPEYTKEEDIAPDFPKPFPAPAHDKKTFSEFGIDDSEIPGEASLSSEDKQEVDTDYDEFFDVREKDISPAISASETESPPGEESEIESPTPDERPFPDGVEEEISDSDTAERRDFQEDPSVDEDDQKIADDKETSDTPPLPITDLSTVEELPLSEEENTSFLEEDEPPISQQVNADEREPEYTKEEDIAPDFPEPFPAPAHDKKTFSEFGIDDSEIPGETPPLSEDSQEVDTDYDVFFDVREKDISPAVSASEAESPPGEESGIESQALDERPFPDGVGEEISDSDTTEGRDFQEDSSVDEDDQKIADDKETSSVASPITPSNLPSDGEEPFIEEEESPIDNLSIGKKKTESRELVEETNEGNEESIYTWNIWHSDPTHNIILAVVIALVAAKTGGWIAGSMRHPKVVGKIITGMLLGNIYLFLGHDYFDFLKTMPFLKMISYFGTLILLLTAGLHTDLRAIFRVGVSSVLVCFGGMAASAGLGIILSNFLLPDISNGSKALLAIVLCSTSTGLLFAILNELKIMDTLEGRVIVGATILTEIIVILSFGIVSGIVVEGGVSLLGISVSFGVASFFLITAVILIFKYGEKFGNFLTNRLTEGLNIPIIVILSLLTAFMFGSIGLHTVIGAFIAGLFLRNVKLRSYDDGEHRNVESYIRPFYALLVPILFVRVGALVDVTSFFNLDAIFLGLAITSAAVLGKLFCAVCPIEKGTKRLVIGFGMAMKLEGTLILAGIGRDVGIFNDTVFSSLIMAIVFTSTVCPFLMKMFVLRKKNSCRESICIDPEKAALVKVPVKKGMQLKIFGLSLI